MKGKNVVNIKKSKFALLGKLAAITVLGTVLPAALPCFNMDTISKVHAGKDEEEFELSQCLVSRFCEEEDRCFRTSNGMALIIPEGFTSIEEGAFSDLDKKIDYIVFPNSLKKLSENAFRNGISENDSSEKIIVFISPECECTGNFPMEVSIIVRKPPSEEFGINGELDSEAVGILSLIPKYAPNGANGLLEIPTFFNSIEHGATVTEICTTPAGLPRKDVPRSFINKTVEFPEGTEEIKDGTLEKMCPSKVENDEVLKTDVERVVIPSTCKNIWPSVFLNCTNLKEIVFKGDDVILPSGPVPFVHGSGIW